MCVCVAGAFPSPLALGANPGSSPGFGVDTKGVRRGTAALVLPYRTGSHVRALQTAASPRLLRKARKVLRSRIYAKSTRGPRATRVRTVKRLLKAARRPYLPVTARALNDVVAALLAGGHRSVANYLGDWKKDHLEAGHAWTDHLVLRRRDLLRAATGVAFKNSSGNGPISDLVLK